MSRVGSHKLKIHTNTHLHLLIISKSKYQWQAGWDVEKRAALSEEFKRKESTGETFQLINVVAL